MAEEVRILTQTMDVLADPGLVYDESGGIVEVAPDGTRRNVGEEMRYVHGPGKVTVVDGDFTTPPNDGAHAICWDDTAARAYFSVRANGAWHVMAGPVA
jgi:hypothetical protein